MAESAFGVEHGEFSKALAAPKMPKIGGGTDFKGAASAAKKVVGGTKPGQFAGGMKQGLQGAAKPFGPQGLRPADRGLRFGSALRQNRGSIGAIAGGGAGAAGTATSMNQRKRG